MAVAVIVHPDGTEEIVKDSITTGTKDGKFDPYSSGTRAQIATFLYRLYLSR